MNKSFLVAFFTLLLSNVIAQPIPGNAVPSVQFSDVNGRFIPMGSNGVQGSQYVFEQFGIGKLMLTNGVEAIDSNLNYSLLDHKLYFIKNKGMYLVNQPVKYFQLNGIDKNNNSLVKNFASGYPPIENNGAATFYEVLGENASYHLLKYTHKSIKETTVYGSAPIKEYATDYVYFVYVIKDKKMLLVGSTLTLKNLKKILPEKATQLDQLNDSLKLNLKKEEDAKTLFEKLN